MPRAFDPPNRFPAADYDPAGKNILFDNNLMPKFDWVAFWLKAVRDMIHKILEFLIGLIAQFTGGLIDLSPIHAIIDEIIDDIAANIGTGNNVLRLWQRIVEIIEAATGINLTFVFMELLPKLLDMLNHLAEIAGASGTAIWELIMLPVNIIRQISKIFSGESVDLSAIPEAFRPLIDAFTNWWAIIGSALPGAIEAAQQALWYLAELLWKLGQNTIGGVADLINKALRQVISPLNTNLWGQIRGAIIPSKHVAEPSPELLDNPDFQGEISISTREVWLWDFGTFGHGSTRLEADGRKKTLVSNPIQVTPGMVIPVEILVAYQSMQTAYGTNSITLSVNAYDWEANLLGTHLLQGIAPTSGAQMTYGKLSGSYTAGATNGVEDAWIAVRLDVNANATRGSIWFYKASTRSTGFTTPQIGFNVVQGIQGIFDIGGTMQTLWDSMSTALQIPGINAPGAITGASLAQVAQGLADLAANVTRSIQVLRSTRSELGLPEVTPESSTATALGTTVLYFPLEWDYIDLAALGGGGGGGALFGVQAGQGGGPGGWAKITLIREGRGLGPPPGAESSYGYIHRDASSVACFVGDGGAGGSGLVGEHGHSGQASFIQWTNPDGSIGTLWAAGGQWGGNATGWNPNSPASAGGIGNGDGIGPGTLFYRDRQYVGGGGVSRGNGQVPGSYPGGGAGGGILRIIPDFGTWGGHGGAGKGWMRAYTAASLEVAV